ncbi:DUF4272 domain-containing protein [Tenacibaculum aiptasiae]|uniref:DUF4272 domain-containing protein n=1 Tax=Tenacibaculum aiptasiae TaxID=426481 RepID=UPI0023305DBE|nr:DUF4272 domain-containing protein [Tenacibaculum aiptasiae]
MWFNKKIRPKRIKKVNTRNLKKNGIEVIDHLPFLDKPNFKDPMEIAERMMILVAVFQLHLGAPNEIIKQWLSGNELMDKLTEEELFFLNTKYAELPEQSQTDIYWYIEAVWSFAWVGGLHNNLTFNTGVENSLITLIPNIQKNESTKQFISNFKFRNQIEIFEMLDKFYRVHWFARNSNLTGEKSDKVSLDIIIERRKALEYTVYESFKWDMIPLDT